MKEYEHQLDEKLAQAQSSLDIKVETSKAEVEASLKQAVDEYLGDQTARRQYRFDALKRLYSAVGPLTYQLVAACQDFAGRVERIGSGKQPYALSLSKYFGRSTNFRLLRILALIELIDRQVTYADFSVDSGMSDLLRFKRAAYRSLSSSSIVLDHHANWEVEEQHIFFDHVSSIASCIIVKDELNAQQRAMRFEEFDRFCEEEINIHRLNPLPSIVENFTPMSKPLFWLRLVALGELCHEFVRLKGPEMGIVVEDFQIEKLVLVTADPLICNKSEEFISEIKQIAHCFDRPCE